MRCAGSVRLMIQIQKKKKEENLPKLKENTNKILIKTRYVFLHFNL